MIVGKRLYVGNLSYNVRSSDLEQLFAAYRNSSTLRPMVYPDETGSVRQPFAVDY